MSEAGLPDGAAVVREWTSAADAWRKWRHEFALQSRVATDLLLEAARVEPGMRILDLASGGKPLRVVSDQWGSPTCTLSLSETISDLIETERWGVYHATDEGVTNWYDFARTIVKGHTVEVQPIETKDFPRPATRPKYSVLDKTTLIQTIGRELEPWQVSLERYLSMRSERLPV